MRKEYDFSNSRPNPYVKKLKRPITIRLDEESIDYFKNMATQMEMPYQSLINLYLKDCVVAHRRPNLKWA